MSGSLTHSPANVIRYLLIAGSQGTLRSSSSAWPIYCNNLATEPDAAMVVYDTAGVEDGTDQISGQQYQHYGVTIAVRHATHAGGWTKANAVAVYLAESVQNVGVTISTSEYMVCSVTKRSGPIPIREQGTKRFLFNINAVASLRQTS